MWSPPHLDGKFKNLVRSFGQECDLRDRSLSYSKPVVRNFKQSCSGFKRNLMNEENDNGEGDKEGEI
jgi:hypothetical protein